MPVNTCQHRLLPDPTVRIGLTCAHTPLSALALLVFVWLVSLLYPQASQAAKSVSWNAVSNTQLTATPTNPIRNRRSNDATLSVTVANVSGQTLDGPFRLVIANLSPASKVSIANASGKTAADEAYFDLAATFAPGAAGLVNVTVTGGGPNIFTYSLRVEQQVTTILPLSVKITRPATLLTVGSTPQTVQGTVSDPAAEVSINGAPVTNNHGTFQADVNLDEGHNSIAARALDAEGQDATDIISLSLDMTPPYLTVASPKEGSTVRSNKIAVSGLINDIVRGTVTEGQAHVTVNGIAASIANRSYLAENVPLDEGENTLKIDAADNVGNTSSLSIKITYQPLAGQHIEAVGGQNQTATINAALPEPLKAKLLDGQGLPVANKPVIFRVTEGDGVVGADTQYQGQGTLANTDALGIAAVPFRLGSRAGVGNQRVRATAVGFDGEALFHATATVGTGDKVTVNSGNNQRGAVGQPLPQPFVVAVIDAGANVVAGAAVEFKASQGGGTFQNGQAYFISTTDSDGRASAELTLGNEEGLDVHRATATLVGTSLYAGFTASALKIGPAGQTRISGVVLDNQDQPLTHVTLRVDGTTREAQTDAQGQFTITEAPVGAVRLIADGSTRNDGNEWSTLAFNLITIAGADNPLPAPVYLVKLDTQNARTVGDQDVILTLPDVPGFVLEVKKGAATFPDGNKVGKLSVTPVNASKIPMPPPNGMQPQFIVTIQPIGTRFDPPARLTLPNTDAHKPGAQVEMFSYDHDLEEFVAIGLGTVSADGSVIRSNEGVGVIKAGWHCGSQPGGSGCCGNPGECKKFDGSCQPVADDGQKPKQTDSKGDCKKLECKNGVPNLANDDGDKPQDTQGDCKKSGCENGSPKIEKDPSDHPSADSCEPKPSTHVETTEFTGEITLDKALGYLNKGLSYLPLPIADTKFEEQYFGTKRQGEECCAECDKPASPQKYSEYSGGARLNIEGFLGKKFVDVKPKIEFFKTYRIGANVVVKAGAKVQLRPNITVSGKLNIGCGNGCVGASGGAALNILPEGDVKVEGYVERDEYGTWVKWLSASGSGEAGLRTGGSINMFAAIGTTCTDADYCSYNYLPISVYYQYKIDFLIPNIFEEDKYTMTDRDEYVLFEGVSGSCS